MLPVADHERAAFSLEPRARTARISKRREFLFRVPVTSCRRAREPQRAVHRVLLHFRHWPPVARIPDSPPDRRPDRERQPTVRGIWPSRLGHRERFARHQACPSAATSSRAGVGCEPCAFALLLGGDRQPWGACVSPRWAPGPSTLASPMRHRMAAGEAPFGIESSRPDTAVAEHHKFAVDERQYFVSPRARRPTFNQSSLDSDFLAMSRSVRAASRSACVRFSACAMCPFFRPRLPPLSPV